MHLNLSYSLDLSFINFNFVHDVHEIPYTQQDNRPQGFYARNFNIPSEAMRVKTYVNINKICPEAVNVMYEFANNILPGAFSKDNIYLISSYGTVPPHIDQPRWKKTGIAVGVQIPEPSYIWSAGSQSTRFSNGSAIIFDSSKEHALITPPDDFNLIIHIFTEIPYNECIKRL